ncbi:MAG: polysaccharide deacetylase family protein [Tepidisphaeraceae bacterium]
MTMSLRLLFGLCASILSSTQPTSVPTFRYDHGGIVRGDVTRKKLSLVFTGGSYAEGVPTILKVCRERHIPAAFFVTGDFVRQHPDAVKAVLNASQFVGPHSDKHLLYCDWSDRSKTLVTEEQFKTDLRANIDALKQVGAKESTLFLPPFEWFNEDQVKWSRELGLTLINFTPGSGSNRDYIPEGEKGFVASKQIADDILAYEQRDGHGLNGFILLLHTGSLRKDKMTEELDRVIVDLQHRGYEFVPASGLVDTSTSR